ncbi:hypothetical protein BC629DRAFT_1739848 [Irpex lacteus]|nr:hypothetical protein BC629DRAFT_1739848 [Irpex lacteus]
MWWVANAAKLLRLASPARKTYIYARFLFPSVLFLVNSRLLSTNTMSRFARPAEDEIIEDSEPEREEERIRRKTKRKISGGRTGISQKDVLPRKQLPCHEVIVISDESDVILGGLGQLNDLNGQLGSAKPVLEQDEPFSWDLPEDILPPPILKAKSTDAPAKPRDPSPVTVRSTSASPEREESPEKPRKLPNFAQYAYTGSRASSLSIVSRPSVPRGPSIPILSHDTPEVTNPPPLPNPRPKPKPATVSPPSKTAN